MDEISDGFLVYYFESSIEEYHKLIKIESIVKRILEEFGIYININMSDDYAKLANKFLMEIEARGLYVSPSVFVYNPDVTFDDIVKQLNYVKQVYLKGEQQDYLDKIIKYCKENARAIMKQNCLIRYVNKYER